jgi:hypothetical protein
VDTVTGYGLDEWGSIAKNVSLPYHIQIASRAQLSSNPVGIGGSFSGCKGAGA